MAAGNGVLAACGVQSAQDDRAAAVDDKDLAMEYVIDGLLQDFEAGKMTRRQLIKSLAVVAMAAAPASSASAQAAPAIPPTTRGRIPTTESHPTSVAKTRSNGTRATDHTTRYPRVPP